MNELTAVSLFAGVGGFDIAFERNGVKVAAAVEIDDAARGVLAHRFPTTTLFTDVCEATGNDLRAAGFVPDRGILVGGFPCQDLSVAGRRAGLAGKRSGLFWEICRLLDETRPRWFVLENVVGLLSSESGRDMGAVVAALVDRGYGIAWRVLDAQHFGVPQRRRRVFIVGCLGDDGRAPFEVLAISEGRERYLAEVDAKGKDAAGQASGSVGSGRILGTDIVGPLAASYHKFPQQQQVRENKLVVQDTDAVLMRQREGKPGGGKGPLLSVEKSLTLATSNDQTLFAPTAYVKVVRSGARDSDGNLPPEVWAEREVAPTLNLMDNTGEARATVLPMQASVVRRLTPTECERLQGFPDGWTAERFDFKKQQVITQPDSARYKQMGNAVAVPVVSWIISRIVAWEAGEL